MRKARDAGEWSLIRPDLEMRTVDLSMITLALKPASAATTSGS
jgi:hypothetical protein